MALRTAGDAWRTGRSGVPRRIPIPYPMNPSVQHVGDLHRPDVAHAQMDDETLITVFQQGDQSAYRYLVERHQERVRNLLFSMFRDQAVVDDMAQEVFIKAYQALPRFRFESSFYTWLYRIAVNRSRDEIRRRKVRRFFSFQPLDEGVEREIHDRLTHPADTRDTHELVHLALELLPETFRTAVILKDIEGLPYEEIAEVMQCEIGTVKSRLSRGRAMLRRALKPLLEEGTR